MTTPRSSQLAVISLIASTCPSRVSQLATISLIGNSKQFYPLDNVIDLPCWQPCTAYGTRAIVIIFK